jgi:3-oxoacyl-[acyl-carrier-protein] synthase-3
MARLGTGFELRGASVALPERRLDNLTLGLELDVDPASIETRTGIESRRIANPEETVASLGSRAALQALEQAGMPASEIDLVLLSTYTPDRLLCPTAPEIAEQIGAKSAGAFDLNSACSGGVTALLTASSLLHTGAFRNVMVVSSDLTSRYIRRDDDKTRLIFGDGAAALVLSAANAGRGRVWQVLASSMGADGTGAPYFSVDAGARRQGINGWSFDNVPAVEMNGRAIFRFGVEQGGLVLSELLGDAQLDPEQVAWVIPHQANLRIIQALIERSGIPAAKWVVNIRDHGNTASASVPIALSGLIDSGRLKPNDVVFLVAFGAGLTWSGLALRVGS